MRPHLLDRAEHEQRDHADRGDQRFRVDGERESKKDTGGEDAAAGALCRIFRRDAVFKEFVYKIVGRKHEECGGSKRNAQPAHRERESAAREQHRREEGEPFIFEQFFAEHPNERNERRREQN